MKIASLFLTGVLFVQNPAVTFRVSTEAVVVDVFVTDGRRSLADLQPTQFEVRDNGVLQEVTDVTREMLAIDLTLLIDTSGSLGQRDRQTVQAAISELRQALKRDDRVTLLTFGSRVVERSLPEDGRSVDLSPVGRGTALFDALLLAYSAPIVTGRRQLTIIMTDGADSSSHFNAERVVDTAKYASTTAFVVLISDRASRSNRRVLEQAANLTGGQLLVARDMSELSAALVSALSTFRTSYVLRYEPRGVDVDGWHNIAVTVRGGSYSVRARAGYFRPASHYRFLIQ